FQHFIVLLTSVTGIGHHHIALPVILILEAIKMVFQCGGIGACMVDTVVCDELFFRTDLRVVGRFELPVLHVVIFQPHEGGIFIGFAVTVPFPQCSQLLFVLYQPWKMFFPKLFKLFLVGFAAALSFSFSKESLSRSSMLSMDRGVSSLPSSDWSSLICDSISDRTLLIFASSFALFFSTEPFHTKV